MDDANATQRSGLLAAAQPIKRGRAQSLLLVFFYYYYYYFVFVFLKNVVFFSRFEEVKAGPCSNF